MDYILRRLRVKNQGGAAAVSVRPAYFVEHIVSKSDADHYNTDEINWGCDGTGTRNLAAAILDHVTDRQTSAALTDAFAASFLAHLPAKSCRIRRGDVLDWISYELIKRQKELRQTAKRREVK